MSHIALIARQRSGTNALGSALNNHPDIFYLNEVFHDHPLIKGRLDGGLTIYNYFYFVTQVYNKPISELFNIGEVFDLYIQYISNNSNKRINIIDIKYNSLANLSYPWRGPLDPPAIFRLLNKNSIPAIRITRINYLAAYISFKTSEKTGVLHKSQIENNETMVIDVDVQNMFSTFNVWGKEDDLIDEWLSICYSVVTFDYSSIFESDGSLSGVVSRAVSSLFPGLEVGGLMPGLLKINTRPMYETVRNFDEVAGALRRTRHAWMLD
jgi:hypothetical protein